MGWWSPGTRHCLHVPQDTATPAPRLDLLAAAIKKRRDVLNMTQGAVERAGGPTEATVSRLERGEGRAPRTRTRRELEYALRFQDWLVDRILAGDIDEHGPELAAVVMRDQPRGGAVVLSGHGSLGAPLNGPVVDSPRLLPLLASTFAEMRKLAPDPSPAEQAALTAVQRAMYGVLGEADLAEIDP